MPAFVPPQRRVLAKHIAALLILSSSTAMASTTWIVNTCTDDNVGDPATHTGSLRFAAASAVSGDTIDLSTQLACSVITLKNGAISLKDDITLNGPGMDALTITGKYGPGDIEHDRIIRHLGNGWLKMNDLSLSYGFLDANAYDDDGGCVESEANVALNHVRVSQCRTYAPNGNGGAVSTKGTLWLLNSQIEDNVAGIYGSSAATYGGGAYVIGDLLAMNSIVSGNAARGAADGGGVFVKGDAMIYYSTISGNNAASNGGGIFARANITIANSTLSGNNAYEGGAMEAESNVYILNSTVTLNTAAEIAGIWLRPYQPMAVSLQSSLIAGNTYVDNGVTKENDLDRCCAAALEAITFSGGNNIVRTPGGVNLPAGIATTGVCPLLGPLGNNGGPTPTHALLSGSPGIDEGDPGNSIYDQRGFFRTSGYGTDIGAYEIDQTEVIFNNAFDGCP